MLLLLLYQSVSNTSNLHPIFALSVSSKILNDLVVHDYLSPCMSHENLQIKQLITLHM